MGMDGVEILVEVEDAFGVALDDQRVAAGRPVRGLVDLVHAVAPRASQERCLGALAFWRLRAALGALGVERARVRPRTALEEVAWPPGLDASQRRAAWRRLADELGLDLPPLVRSRALVAALTTACLGALVGLLLAGGPAWLAAAAAAGLALLLVVATRPLRGTPPVATVGDLSRTLVVREAARIAAPAGGFTRAQIEAILPRIVAEHQGLPLERVTLSARFVDDLGIS